MVEPGSYLLDANVFIQAKNSYYSFAICLGFWNSLVGLFSTGELCSIDYIRQELLRGNDDLAEWVESEVPDEFFLNTQEDATRQQYREIILWVQRSSQYHPLAKAAFAASADGWLLAYAQVNNLVVVTHEQLRVGAKNTVPIPNVCEHFGIEYQDTFNMLKILDVQYEWNAG
ncbi:MAG: DUF4411 family protein [Candidatus Hydrogenedentes bacterium]|nr:DUF4411 family protein [Candidatus Hydrogenedentota bacterium]